MKSSNRRLAILVVLGSLALVSLLACAENETEKTEVSKLDPTATNEPVVITVTPMPTPTPDLAPVVMSDEQAVLEIWDSQVEVIVSEQYDRLHESCEPGYADRETRSTATVRDEFRYYVDRMWDVPIPELEFSEPSVQIIGGNKAILTVGVANSPRAHEPFAIFFSKDPDGSWYDDCAPNDWKSRGLSGSTASSTESEPSLSEDQVALLEIWDSQMEVIANRDWDRLNEHCYPGYEEIDNRTDEEVEEQFREFLRVFWELSLEEAVFSNPNPVVFYGTQAVIEFNVERVNGRAPFHEAAQYSRHEDGKWYDDCALGGMKSLRLQPAAAEISKAEIASEDSVPATTHQDVTDLSLRSLPTELDSESETETLSESRVVDLWTEFLTGAYLDLTGSGDFYHLCANGVLVAGNTSAVVEFVTESPDAWYVEEPSSAESTDFRSAALRLVPIVHRDSGFATSVSLGVTDNEPTGSWGWYSGPMPVYESSLCEKMSTNEPQVDTDR